MTERADSRQTLARNCQTGAVGCVFHRHAQRLQPVADAVGLLELAGLAQGGSRFQQQLDEGPGPGVRRAIVSGALREGQAEDAPQIAQSVLRAGNRASFVAAAVYVTG